MEASRRTLLLGLFAAAAAACGRPPAPTRPGPRGAAQPRTPPQKGARPEGLDAATAFVTVEGSGHRVRLDAQRTRAALDAVWQVLGDVPALAPVAGGPRLLAVVRVNEQVLDVAVWKPQTLVVAALRVQNVSAIVVPTTGTWRHRLLMVQMGRVFASPRLLDSPALALLDETVRAAVGPR